MFSGLYFVSGVLELIHGGFSTRQLVLTYLAEAAIPLFVVGLYAVQRPRIGSLGSSVRSATSTPSSPAPCCSRW